MRDDSKQREFVLGQFVQGIFVQGIFVQGIFVQGIVVQGIVVQGIFVQGILNIHIHTHILFFIGYGAPNASINKENLMKMLHYPESAAKNVL